MGAATALQPVPAGGMYSIRYSDAVHSPSAPLRWSIAARAVSSLVWSRDR